LKLCPYIQTTRLTKHSNTHNLIDSVSTHMSLKQIVDNIIADFPPQGSAAWDHYMTPSYKTSYQGPLQISERDVEEFMNSITSVYMNITYKPIDEQTSDAIGLLLESMAKGQ
jgi:hypothetical protein